MNVTPDPIDRDVGATISHDGEGVLVVTIKGSDNTEEVIEVPPGSGVTWFPPPGWTQATFSAPGHADEVRSIQ